MLDHFTSEDKEEDDTDHHNLAREQAREPVDTADDEEFTVQETRRAIARMDSKKALSIDGIT